MLPPLVELTAAPLGDPEAAAEEFEDSGYRSKLIIQ